MIRAISSGHPVRCLALAIAAVLLPSIGRVSGLPAPIYCAGMVIRGSFSLLPVSASVKKNMIAVSARLVCRSPLSTQNQWSR